MVLCYYYSLLKHVNQVLAVVYNRVVDPDSVTLWIRNRTRYWESGSGSRGKKIKKFQWKKCTF
jgi:hypothetical protein